MKYYTPQHKQLTLDGPTDFVRGRGLCETIIKTIMLR